MTISRKLHARESATMPVRNREPESFSDSSSRRRNQQPFSREKADFCSCFAAGQ